MQNLYTSSKILPEEKFKKIENIFHKIWNKDTTFYSVADEWSVKNKALGQCAVTSLIIFDLFGGKIIYDKPNFHVFNELPDGTWQDFSREQFKDERVFSVTRYQTKTDVLKGETAVKNNTKQKYMILKNRFDELFKNS
jgi:hypothetical protein